MLQDCVSKEYLQEGYIVSKDEGIRAESFFVNRQYKDSLFRLLFKDKKNLLSLYNALNHSSYDNPEDLEIRTIENAIYMGMKNDISFVLDNYIYLYEHQSQDNPNMPLRYLLYISAQIRGMVDNNDLHRRNIVRIPIPRFIVFYNGTDKRPDYYELKLSDAYEVPDPQPSLELKAQIYNINIGHNAELLETCRILKDYSTYVDMVRRYAKDYPIEIAVDKSIEECIQSDILRDFLIKHKQEAREMSIFEYDYNGHMQVIREEGKEDGVTDGLVLAKKIMKLSAAGKTIEEIAKECEVTEDKVRFIIEE